MVDLTKVSHHPSVEGIAKVLCNRTRKNDPKFFRLLTVYYMSVMAASMRAKVYTKDRGEIPINNYVVALAPSGFGKGASTYVLENEIMSDFRMVFRDHVMPTKAEDNMWRLANKRAALAGTEEQHEFDTLKKELDSCGEYPFVFDGASEPAIKQIRQMLLLSGCGSINYQVDEIGSNLEKSGEALNTYLELYDQGMIKAKLTKNSNDNKRGKEIEGKTPANMLGFGTGSRLLDGAMIEKKFMSLLETGYARRCLFASGDPTTAMDLDSTPEEVYKRRIDPVNDAAIDAWRQHFASLADIDKLDWTIEVPEDVGIALLSYQFDCERAARELPEHDEIQKAELMHRYFKALKVAGTFAFVEESLTMTMDQLMAAIKLTEESGEAFTSIMQREAPYMKLARYVAECKATLTQSDLDQALPFYKGGQKERSDMMTMATAWGYKQHIVIKKQFIDGIEFFSGETLEETNLEELTLSYSDDFAYHYSDEKASFEDLHLLTQSKDLHWANHHFNNGHRCEDEVIPGFNMIVLDVDGGITLDATHELMKDYMFMTSTTKRHTDEDHRFRLILPTTYKLELDREDYREFMRNLVDWLPFQVDEAANQRSKKWMTNDKGTYHYNLDGQLLDILPFVPKTSKNEQHRKEVAELGSLDSLERWFAQRFAEGNRNNQMIKFALALVDAGMNYAEVEDKVIAFNNKISNGLDSEELRRTVLMSVAKKIQSAP